MLNRLIHWSLDNRFLVLTLAAILVVGSLFAFQGMDVDVLPDFAPPKVEVQTEARGFVAEEVESLVTLPLESAINGTPGVTSVKSISMAGISKLTILFQDGTNIYTDRQLVAEKLQLARAHLPTGIGVPTMEPVSSELGDIMKIGLVSDKLSQMDLRTLADWDIRNRILAVPGVSRVVVFGGDQRQFQVLIDPEKMRSMDVTLDQVATAVRSCNSVSPQGFLVSPDRQVPIHGLMRVNGLYDIEESVVVQRGGVPIKIRHVADVKEGPAFPVGDARINGQRGVEIIVTKQPGYSTLEATAQAEQVLASIQKEHPELKIVNIFRQADFIHQSISNMSSAILMGGAIVVVVLLFFLFNWRTSVISLTAIPLSLLCAVAVLKALGGTINTMTLGGLAIAVGEVVDDAVVDVENAYRRLRQNRASSSPRNPLSVILQSCSEVRSSVVYATFVVALVFLPVFTLSGVEGKLFGQLGLAYVSATVSSLLVALTVTPALCGLLLHRDAAVPKHEPIVLLGVKRLYSQFLSFAMARPAAIMCMATVMFIVSIAMLPFMGRQFMPRFEEKDLMIPTSAMAGQSLEASSRMGTVVEKAFSEIPGVAAVGQRAGRAELDDDAAATNFSEFDVRLKDDADLESTSEKIRKVLGSVPGITFEVASFLTDHINDVLSGGTQADLVVKVFGPDVPELRKLSGDISTALEGSPGIVDVTPEQQLFIPQVDIVFDRQQAARYGITADALANTIDAVLDGPIVSQVLDDQKLFGLRIWGEPSSRGSLVDIGNIPIDTANGGKIPLDEIAKVNMAVGPNALVRENVMRRIAVLANVSGRDMVGIVSRAKAKVERQLKLPPGYYVVWSGQYAAERESAQRLIMVSIASLCGILVLLARGLGGFRAALVVASNLPLAAIGGVLAVAVAGNTLSIGSTIGFISLFGISTRNSLLLVSHINQLSQSGMRLQRAIYQGSLDRVAPVLMTALTAALGMLPLAVLGGSGRELEQPLAVVIVGGLITSTLLTLLVIPALYCLFGRALVPVPSIDEVEELQSVASGETA